MGRLFPIRQKLNNNQAFVLILLYALRAPKLATGFVGPPATVGLAPL